MYYTEWFNADTPDMGDDPVGDMETIEEHRRIVSCFFFRFDFFFALRHASFYLEVCTSNSKYHFAYKNKKKWGY